jgi:hypothetical protein
VGSWLSLGSAIAEQLATFGKPFHVSIAAVPDAAVVQDMAFEQASYILLCLMLQL